MRAIILCGGEGKKIWPYSEKNQKACLPIGGVPNVLRIARQLRALGIRDQVFVTGYRREQVEYILRKEEDIRFEYADAKQLQQAVYESGKGADSMLIYYGDVYVQDSDISKLIVSFKERGDSVLLEKKGEQFQTTDYICAEANGRVNAYYGHPRSHYVNSRSAGVFALSPEIFERLKFSPGHFLNLCVGGMPEDGFYVEQCLQTAIEDGAELTAVYLEHGFADLDFPWDIMKANEQFCMEMSDNLRETYIDPTASVSPNVRAEGYLKIGRNTVIGDNVIFEGNCIIGDNCTIANGAIIGDGVVIGDNCDIRNYCKLSPYTVIGNKNKIGFLAEVTGVTFDGVAAVHHCEIYGVIGRNTDIAADCQMGILRFDDQQTRQKIGAKYYSDHFSNGVFLGDYVRTGIGNIFSPGVKVGACSALGSGMIVDKDIPSNTLVLVKQEIVEKSWGPERYGW